MTDNVLVLHDVYDREYASDGRSRLSAYLARHTRRFRDWDGRLTRSPVEFTAVVFRVATAPIMNPPYVGTHLRVVNAAPCWDEDRRCGLVIDLATPTPPALADQLPTRAGGWVRDTTSGRFFPPENNGELTAYSRLTVRVPFPVDLLPDPVYTDIGVADVDTAKRALRALTNHANSVLTHLIRILAGGDGGTDGSGGGRRWN